MSDTSKFPRVTIGLPVYNGEQFLPRTMENLLALDYPNFEIIISDNASEDSTETICRHYAGLDGRIRYSRNLSNLGPVGNSRKIAEMCTSPYIMWATDHDLRHPSYISRLLREFDQDPGVVLAYSRTIFIDVEDKVKEYAPDLLETRELPAVERFRKIMWHYLWGNMVFGLYRTDAFRKLLEQEFNCAAMDHLQMAFLSLLGSIAQVDEFLFYRRDNRPEEDERATRRRQLEWCVKEGLARVVPMTMMAYGHVKVVQESTLPVAEKEFLYSEIKSCFQHRFGPQMRAEAERLDEAWRKRSAEAASLPATARVLGVEFAGYAEICRFFDSPPQAACALPAATTGVQPRTLAQAMTAAAKERPVPRAAEDERAPGPLPTGSAQGKPSILFINTYYEGFLRQHYLQHPGLEAEPYAVQHASLQSECFGDSDFYSAGLIGVGWQAEDVIVNASPLQAAWAREHAFQGEGFDVAVEQIRVSRPDVVYLQDLNLGNREFVEAIRPHARLIVGQIASPLPSQAHLAGFDIIISSFPHFVERLRQAGITSYYQPLAFDPRVLERTREPARDIPLSFVGGISPNHGKGLETLEKLAGLVPLHFWGYGAAHLDPASPIAGRHHGEAWGREMFTLLRRSQITLNRHIDVAEDYANNMRLFEATGCGALLVTDYKENLNDLFEIGKEVVAYRTPEECAALIQYYLTHPEEAAEIARAGQERTLRDHGYPRRMEQTAEILERHLRYRSDSDRLPPLDAAGISYGHTPIEAAEVTPALTRGWQDPGTPARQRALVQQELPRMYRGDVVPAFLVLAELLKPHLKRGTRLLEIGCASGYYYEILQYLLNRRIDYTGVDYSEPLIAMARDYYPQALFYTRDGADLLFPERSFDVVVSSCVLLHVPNYRDHIAETARVANRLIVAARTPITRRRPTQHLKKFAYGVETVELGFNEEELIREFARNGFSLLRAIQYQGDEAADLYSTSYLFGRS